MAYKWSDQETEIVKTMSEKGFKAHDIKKVLKGRSIDAIQLKAGSLGCSLNGAPPEIDMDEFARLMKKAT